MSIRYGASFIGAEFKSYGDGVEALLGKKLAIQQVQSAYPYMNSIEYEAILRAGRTPMVQAGPDGGGEALFRAIIRGDYDAPIRQLALTAESLKHLGPILFRTMHEVNCCYGWRVLGGDTFLGNLYKEAWAHIYDLIVSITDNLLLGFCPNVEFLGDNIDYRFDSTIPPWNKMHWIGIDGYWIGADQGWEVYEYTINHLNQLGMQAAGKKLIIAEWGVREFGDNGAGKAAIVRKALLEWFSTVSNMLAVVMFHFNFMGDPFHMDSSVAALQAYKDGYAGYSSEMLKLSDFSEGTPPPVPTTDIYASDLAYSVVKNGWGTPRKDLSIEGKPLKLAGVVYAKGFGLHANAELKIPVPANMTRFTAKAGIDDEVQAGTGSVEVSVLSGTTVLAKSSVMKQGQPPFTFDLDMAGKTSLTVLFNSPTTDLNFDHVDLVDAKFELGGTPVPPTDLTPRVTALEAAVTALKAENTTLKADVAALKTRVATLEAKTHKHTVTVSEAG